MVARALALLVVIASMTSTAAAQSAGDVTDLRQQVLALHEQGRYDEAEPIAERYVELARRRHGEQHPEYGMAIDWLAAVYSGQNRLSKAEPLHVRVLAMTEHRLGLEHPLVARMLNNLADNYRKQGRYRAAEPMFRRALAIREKAVGAEHPDLGEILTNLGLLYHSQGRYDDAELVYRRDLAIAEKALGTEHPDVGTSLNNLGALYLSQERYREAEGLFRRDLAIQEKEYGPDHRDVATSLNNLAQLYTNQGKLADAEPLFERSLAIRERALGPSDPLLGTSLSNIAALYVEQQRYPLAEQSAKRALEIFQRVRGAEHPDIGLALNALAAAYDFQERYDEAESTYKRALAIAERTLGITHSRVNASLNNLASLYFAQGQWVRAADAWRRSTAALTQQIEQGSPEVGQSLTGKRKDEAHRSSFQFKGLVQALHRLRPDEPDGAKLVEVTFKAAQWAQSSEAAASLAQMAVRGAKGDAKLAAAVRRRQDLFIDWQERDLLRLTTLSQSPENRDPRAEAVNAAELVKIGSSISELDKELRTKFPNYVALARPTAASVQDVQDNLGHDEALVLFLDTSKYRSHSEETFIWVVTKTSMRWVRSDVGSGTLTREVAALRCGLDITAWTDAGGERCAKLFNFESTALPPTLPFFHGRALALYRALFGEVEDLIKDKHLLLVPSGPLTQLPFHVLVTAPVPEQRPAHCKFGQGTNEGFFEPCIADHRTIAWMARVHAITVLPAVSSLKTLRRVAKPSAATKPIVGFGNPLLDGPDQRYAPSAELARATQRCPAARVPEAASLRSLRRGTTPVAMRKGLATPADLKLQTPLPETAEELCAVARDLGASAGETHLGMKATESRIKKLSQTGDLARYRIVHFATHGILAGQLTGTNEPGLVLTPPNTATVEDDGYLSASEIAALKLDAEWVILSACNTAAGGTQGAEALSGLASAFFYAQARALLVSHWEVYSEATVELITKTMKAITLDKTVGRAEALRRAMLALIDSGEPHEAHPSYWAPFVVVGEGAAPKPARERALRKGRRG